MNHSDVWRYRRGTSAPQSNWKTVSEGGLDGTWLSGNGGFGYASNPAETALCQTLLPNMAGIHKTVAMRRSFQVTNNVDPGFHLTLTMDWDDGFIAWLDGAYLTSFNSPGSPSEPAFDAEATDLHESSRGDSTKQPAMTFDLGAIGPRLAIGTHVLAIVGLNDGISSSDFIQIADLALAPGPTNGVSGVIGIDTVWYASNSPVRVVGNIQVNPGATLTIEPGVQVLFDTALSLRVENGGRLLAEGNPTNRILFARSAANSSTWEGIIVNGGTNSPETRIRYAHINHNSSDAVAVNEGTVWLDNLTFGAHDHRYVDLVGASFVVSECSFPSAAVKFEFIHGSSGIKTNGYGIIRRNFFGLPVGYSDVIDFTGGSRPGPIVQIIDNVFSGASDDGVDIDGTDAWVEGNIFLHVHRNGDTPDSGAAVSGGDRNGGTSEITIVGNIFFDCDNAATAKQGNFFTMLNNTIVHTTHTGGVDFAAGAINVRDTTPSLTTFARGFYLEGNIIYDAEQLVRNYDAAQTSVTISNNILPAAWTGPGGGNSVTNPLFRHTPTLGETTFTNWAQAQIMRDWLDLSPGSTAIGTGPQGKDKGGVIPVGAYLSGEPVGVTSETNAILRVGFNRTGFGIPAAGWPSGSGYTSYRWRLDNGAWSADRPINSPVVLNGLAAGPHYVEVVGKRDSGMYQDNPLLGADAAITRSRTWTVDSLRLSGVEYVNNQFQFQFSARTGQTYTAEYRDALDAAHAWVRLTNISTHTTNGPVTVIDGSPNPASRFYRMMSPAQP